MKLELLRTIFTIIAWLLLNYCVITSDFEKAIFLILLLIYEKNI